MSSRPKRARKAPARFQSYVTGAIESDDLSAEEAPRRAPKRRQPAVKKEEASVGDLVPIEAAVKNEEAFPEALLSPPAPAPKNTRTPARRPAPAPPSPPAPRHSQTTSAALPRHSHGQRITLTRAKDTYKLNDREIKALPHELVVNPRSADYAPMQLYDEEGVYDLAIQKWGSAEGVVEAQEASHRRGAAMKASRERKKREQEEAGNRELQERRERQAYVDAWLAAVGVPPVAAAAPEALQEYINSGIGVESIETTVNEAKAAYEARMMALVAALVAAGLSPTDAALPAFEEYLKGTGGAEAEVQRYVDTVSRFQRAAAVEAAVVAAGLPVSKVYSPLFDEYRRAGEGLDAAMAAVAAEEEGQRGELQEALGV